MCVCVCECVGDWQAVCARGCGAGNRRPVDPRRARRLWGSGANRMGISGARLERDGARMVLFFTRCHVCFSSQLGHQRHMACHSCVIVWHLFERPCSQVFGISFDALLCRLGLQVCAHMWMGGLGCMCEVQARVCVGGHTLMCLISRQCRFHFARHVCVRPHVRSFLTGTLEPFTALTLMTDLYVSGNAIEGDLIPLRKLTGLVNLNLHQNHLVGTLEPLENATSLQFLDGTFSCGVSWHVSASFSQSHTMSRHVTSRVCVCFLSVSHNKFTGTLTIVSKMVNMTFLATEDNSFTGMRVEQTLPARENGWWSLV
jgi:hypothetical protein